MRKKTKEVVALPESLQMITGEWFLVNPSYVYLDKVLLGNHLDDFQDSKWRKRLGCDENKGYREVM